MSEQPWWPPSDASSVASALLAGDPLHAEPAVASYFGDHYSAVRRFAELLAIEGERRGLLGPREYDRLWERHILNSAALVPHLPAGALADVGSGAGLPGIVIAAIEPDREVILIEPMERRVAWLSDAARVLGLDNVRLVRGRAEEFAQSLSVQVVTARAVAPVDKLVKWCAPLLAPGGQMVLLKGRSAHDEVEKARFALRKAGLSAEILEADTLEGVEATTVVRLRPQ